VNNYLLGNQPPAFDILYWNADTTRLPASPATATYLDLYFTNPFANPGKLVLNEKDHRHEQSRRGHLCRRGAWTDHITPWKGVYKTAQILGEDTTFVLSNSGHLQSLLNPPTNPKGVLRDRTCQSGGGPMLSLAAAEKRKGSWWLDWRDWLHARLPVKRSPAPASLGSERHPVLAKAPGTYVFD